MPSRSSKTWTRLTHCQSRCRCWHTVRHHHHLTYHSCSTPHLTCTHHVGTRDSHSTLDHTTVLFGSQKVHTRPSWHNHFSLCHTKHQWTRRGGAEVHARTLSAPDSQQRDMLTQYTADKPPSLTHTHTATRDPLAPPTDHAVGAAPSASYQQCCWLPSRPSKTWTSLRHHRRWSRSRHTVRHLHHLTRQSCGTPHITCTHHVSSRASHSTTTLIAESTPTPATAQSLQPLPLYISVDASWWFLERTHGP